MGKKIAIVGMGISGLKSAHRLLKKSPHLFSSLTFFEKNTGLGGVLNSILENNYRLEEGAQGVLLSRESFKETLKELKIENKILIPDKKLGTRYLIQKNSCVPISLNFYKLWKNKLINLNSILKIIKVFVFKKRSQPLLNETIYQYFLRLLGKKIALNFCVPFCFGIWGGAARKLLCRFCFPGFPNLKNKPQGLASFETGMNFLAKSLFDDILKLCEQNKILLKVNYECCVSSIIKNEKELEIKFINSEKKFIAEHFDIVIYTGQPWREQEIYFGSGVQHARALEVLKKIPNHSLVVVGIGGVKKANFNYRDGFGALANEDSKDLLGILFIHSTYKMHVPDKGFLYRILLGGDRDIEINNLNDEEIFSRAYKHLVNLQLLSGDEKVDFKKVIRYKNYIPLSTIYQDEVFTAIWQLEALNAGLFFAGNYLEGVSVSNCIEFANKTADKVLKFMMEQE